jgi:hypothetical protein
MTKLTTIIILTFFALLPIVRKDSFAKAITTNITIDGRINEPAWENNSDIATNFVMFEPIMADQLAMKNEQK